MSNPRLTAQDLTRAISYLPRDRRYHYINPRTRTILAIHNVQLPEGPIFIHRWNPDKGDSYEDAEPEPISTEMLARVAHAFVPNHPINIDRILGASYNTRSALETLLAHTPEFYYCYPGRIDSYSNQIKRGHKHLMWCPDDPHQSGTISQKETAVVISEITFETTHETLEIPSELLSGEMDIDLARQHARIQVALILIGQQLGYRTWVAQNDKGIRYHGQSLAEMSSVVPSLGEEFLLGMNPDAIRAATHIDCIWFQNTRYMPAVMEIEHSTGITSGLTRMRGLQETIPSLLTRYVVVADDEQRHAVIDKASQPQFRALNVRYLPYSAVEELYHLCQRRRIRGVTHEFLDAYMEPILSG